MALHILPFELFESQQHKRVFGRNNLDQFQPIGEWAKRKRNQDKLNAKIQEVVDYIMTEMFPYWLEEGKREIGEKFGSQDDFHWFLDDVVFATASEVYIEFGEEFVQDHRLEIIDEAIEAFEQKSTSTPAPETGGTPVQEVVDFIVNEIRDLYKTRRLPPPTEKNIENYLDGYVFDETSMVCHKFGKKVVFGHEGEIIDKVLTAFVITDDPTPKPPRRPVTPALEPHSNPRTIDPDRPTPPGHDEVRF